MNQSDDVKTYTDLMYIGPTSTLNDDIQSYLDSNPTSAAQTFVSTIGAPDSTWDSSDTANTGKNFGVGFFTQDTATGIVYRCFDATPSAAVWRIVVQQTI
jgi:hypothetical protein